MEVRAIREPLTFFQDNVAKNGYRIDHSTVPAALLELMLALLVGCDCAVHDAVHMLDVAPTEANLALRQTAERLARLQWPAMVDVSARHTDCAAIITIRYAPSPHRKAQLKTADRKLIV